MLKALFSKAYYEIISIVTGSAPLSRKKLNLLDLVLIKNEINSFADLGGVWRVNSGYSFYILDKKPIKKAYFVDETFTNAVRKKIQNYPHVELIEGDFRYKKTMDKVPSVDLMILFDVVLHQPEWQNMLALCVPKSKIVAIYQPQYIGEKTIRLLDLPKDKYLELINEQEKGDYKEIFKSPENIEKYKQITKVWQWGMTDKDLIEEMKKLGYTLTEKIEEENIDNKKIVRKGFVFKDLNKK